MFSLCEKSLRVKCSFAYRFCSETLVSWATPEHEKKNYSERWCEEVKKISWSPWFVFTVTTKLSSRTKIQQFIKIKLPRLAWSVLTRLALASLSAPTSFPSLVFSWSCPCRGLSPFSASFKRFITAAPSPSSHRFLQLSPATWGPCCVDTKDLIDSRVKDSRKESDKK